MKSLLLKTQQSGQAVLEYVLLLFVIVTVFLGFMLGLAEGTRRFADNYFGAYFQCLLETGELPSLGGSSNANQSECDEQYQEFTLAGGRPPISTDLSGASGSSSGVNTSSNADSENSAGAGSEGSSSSGLVPTGSGESFGSNGFGRTQKVPIAKNNAGKKAGDGATTQGGLVSNASGEDSSSGGSSAGGSGGFAGGRNFSEEEGAGSPTLVPVAAGKNDDADLRETKRVPAQTEIKKEVAADTDPGLTLPNFLRYIIIIAVILAIVVFFGGQVLQYQKSKE